MVGLFGVEVSADYQAETSLAVLGIGARRIEGPVCSAGVSYDAQPMTCTRLSEAAQR